MRDQPCQLAERGRIKRGPYGTTKADGCTGAFQVGPICMIASDGSDWDEAGLDGPRWEHVSVSREDRIPNWEEMCMVKAWFWKPEESVIQFHPRESQYVNQHPNCLHLWKPIGVELPEPPTITVGLR